MARRGRRTGVRAVFAAVCLLLGLLLSARPFVSPSLVSLSLSVGLLASAAAELASGAGSDRVRRTVAAIQAAAALVVGLWPALPLPVVSAAVGMSLVASGAVEFWTGLASGGTWPALVGGGISLVTGAVATLWADPVLVPAVIALGWRLAVLGAGPLIDLWYPPGLLGTRRVPQRNLGRAVALGLAVVVTCAAVGTDPHGWVSGVRGVEVPAGARAGDLLSAKDYPGAPQGASAFRLLYATTEPDGTVLPASAILYVPDATTAPELPLVTWLHGTTGIAADCAPSLLGEQAGGLASITPMMTAGYAVLAPDLTGLGVPGPSSYLVGEAEGRAVLDAIVATAAVPGLRIGPSVLLGYGQGGHAALWAAQLAAGYAPGVRIAAVATVAPATDLQALFAAAIASGQAGTLGAQVLATYSGRYPEIRPDAYTSANSRLLEEVASRCLGDRGVVGAAWAQASGLDQSWTMPAGSPLAVRLGENTPSGPYAEPVLVVQGAADGVIPAIVQDDWVQAQCSVGTALQYRKLPGVDHAGIVRPDSATTNWILGWIGDRFAGRSVPATCE